MRLNKIEEQMLDGKHSEAAQRSIELLVAIGECYGATEMVPVASAHLASSNLVAAGVGGAGFIKEMAVKGGAFMVPTTTNPSCVDPWRMTDMGFDSELKEKQAAYSEVLAGMGGFLCHTCTPYLIGHIPRLGEHIAWGESSAVVYANSVLGARTNREGAPASLAAAITGRTPAYGFHLDENRHASIKVVVSVPLQGATEYGLLGYYIGAIAGNRTPVFTGMQIRVHRDELKGLGAGLATSGSVALYHIVGVTPEAPTEQAARGSNAIGMSDTFHFGPDELKKARESLKSSETDQCNLAILGCPHASIEQVKEWAMLFSGKKARDEVWILVSHMVARYAEDLGYLSVLESAGAKIISNFCPVSLRPEFLRKRGLGKIATESPKMAFYIRETQDVQCSVVDADSLIRSFSGS